MFWVVLVNQLPREASPLSSLCIIVESCTPSDARAFYSGSAKSTRRIAGAGWCCGTDLVTGQMTDRPGRFSSRDHSQSLEDPSSFLILVFNPGQLPGVLFTKRD